MGKRLNWGQRNAVRHRDDQRVAWVRKGTNDLSKYLTPERRQFLADQKDYFAHTGEAKALYTDTVIITELRTVYFNAWAADLLKKRIAAGLPPHVSMVPE